MAFDISQGDTAPPAPPTETSFEEFHAAQAQVLGAALALACNDDALAERATAEALASTAQRWRHLAEAPDIFGSAFEAGLEYAEKTLRLRPPLALNEATGGYVRGLPLDQALASLPLRQRSALVMAHHLGWTDEHASLATGERLETITTRHNRAVSFLAHHLRTTPDEASASAARFLESAVDTDRSTIPAASTSRRVGRRRLIRNRVAVAALGIAVIAGGAGLVQVASRTTDNEVVGPAPVAPPTNSSDWLPPVGDGRGGFIAVNIAGASRFVRSAEGIDWFEHELWNSRAVNIRTRVTGFTRAGGRYIATIEDAGFGGTSENPRIATSANLRDWDVTEIDVGELPAAPGLQSQAEVINVAATDSRILVAVELAESIDYRALDLERDQVCVDVLFDVVRALHLCGGEVVTIDRPARNTRTPTRYFVAGSDQVFAEIELPNGTDARSLTSSRSQFAVTDTTSGQLSTSFDGLTWTPVSDLADVSRFVLVEGNAADQLLAVLPSETGWSSALLQVGADPIQADIELALDPAVVWTKPEVAVGPAGWAMFVTTSRPWERGSVTPGWAVDTGTWVVSRLPDSEIISARNRDRSTTYRFDGESDAVQNIDGGGIRLALPDTADSFIEITGAQIARSRVVDGGAGRTKAQVFFSADGTSWRSLWETDDDAWFGSLAVGDDEVLLSGAALTGAPIAVPVE